MVHSCRILLVENSQEDYLLTQAMLSQAQGTLFEVIWSPSFSSALAFAKEQVFDAILVDFDLGDQTGVDLVRSLVAQGCKAPMILLTGQGDYTLDVKAMRAGVSDYLSKEEVSPLLLERAIRYAILHKKNEEQLRRSRDELEQRVQERTWELHQANQDLRVEIKERIRIEKQLRKYSARVEALAEFSRLLSKAAPNYEGVLETISQQVSRLIGDACVVTLLSDDKEWLYTASVYHPDEERAKLLRTSLIRASRQMNQGLRWQVAASGESLHMFSVMEEASLPEAGPGQPGRERSQPGIHALMIVPLRSQGEIIGTLGVSRDQPGKPYAEEDRLFFEDIATRAAMAIANARLFRAMQNELAERKRVEAELAEIQRRLLDSVEAERLNLAQELHDGPMQELYGLSYQVKALSEGSVPGLAEALPASLEEIIQSLRVIAGELRPPSLAPFGLEKAIRSHLEQIQPVQPNIHFLLDLHPDGKQLPERVRLALFRIYQVALTNVLRHSGASQVKILLHLAGHKTILEIQDNGCGFSLPERWIELAREGHLGLVGAHERAEAVGGKLIIHSDIGEGTSIRAEVPLTQDEQVLPLV